MKPFDLQAAMRGEPIVTRDGRKAKFVAYVPEAEEPSRLVVLDERTGCVSLIYETGKFSTYADSMEDLFMAPPPMRSINGHEFPEPVREPLKEGQGYWLVVPTDQGGASYGTWSGRECEFRWLDRGLIQLTEKGAQQQLKALILTSGGEL